MARSKRCYLPLKGRPKRTWTHNTRPADLGLIVQNSSWEAPGGPPAESRAGRKLLRYWRGGRQSSSVRLLPESGSGDAAEVNCWLF